MDLQIPAGSMYGLVGRNGAGKTTTLSMATGLLRPDGGTALVRGTDVWAEPLRAKATLGVLPDGVHLFDRLSGRQLISYSGLLHGLDRDLVAERAQELLVALDLHDAADRMAAPGIELLGPVTAPMSRRAGLYRMQLLLSAATRPVLHALLDAALPAIHALPEARRTRWSLDLDPIDLY